MEKSMNKIVTTILFLFANFAVACEQNLSPYLDKAKEIAKTLPQSNATLEGSTKYDDGYWIDDPAIRKIGGYRYLLHDIAVGYSRISCWNQAMDTANLISNAGVKDSALAQISIEYAKKDDFDHSVKLIKAIKYPEGGAIARKYVSAELVRAGRTNEARILLRGAGLFGNHYDSYFYRNAMNLAKLGKHDEAIEYVKSLNGMKDHVRNAFGDMLLLFQEKGDEVNCKKIISYYDGNKENDLPLYQMAAYYKKLNNIEKANKYISQVSDPQLRALLLLDLAALDKDDIFYNQAIKVIEKEYSADPKNNWTIVGHTAYKVYSLKGQKTSNEFINKYIDKADYKAEIAHSNIIKKLFSTGKAEEVLIYLDNIDGKLRDGSYITAVANIRTKNAIDIPDMDVVQNNQFRYRFIIIEALKSKYSESAILKAILKNYPTESSTFQKSELLNITAMVASNNLTPSVAEKFYESKDEPLSYASWLIGISQKNQAGDIYTTLPYELYL